MSRGRKVKGKFSNSDRMAAFATAKDRREWRDWPKRMTQTRMPAQNADSDWDGDNMKRRRENEENPVNSLFKQARHCYSIIVVKKNQNSPIFFRSTSRVAQCGVFSRRRKSQ